MRLQLNRGKNKKNERIERIALPSSYSAKKVFEEEVSSDMKILKRTGADIAPWRTPASIVEIEERLYLRDLLS